MCVVRLCLVQAVSSSLLSRLSITLRLRQTRPGPWRHVNKPCLLRQTQPLPPWKFSRVSSVKCDQEPEATPPPTIAGPFPPISRERRGRLNDLSLTLALSLLFTICPGFVPRLSQGPCLYFD
ncbi:hypothetical protein V8C44DRAFT_342337 [Trichoderma aethiopicum]